MKRNGIGVLRALIVESLAVLLLLLLLFPAADQTAFNEPDSLRANEGEAQRADTDSTTSTAQPHRLPLLLLPPPSGEETAPDRRPRTEPEQRDGQRSAFVERELEYAGRALTTLVQSHVKYLARDAVSRDSGREMR